MKKNKINYEIKQSIKKIKATPIDNLEEKFYLNSNFLTSLYFTLDYSKNYDINNINYEKFKTHIQNKELSEFAELYLDTELIYAIRTQIIRIKEAIETSKILMKTENRLIFPLIIRFIMELYSFIENCEDLLSIYYNSQYPNDEIKDTILRMSSGTKKDIKKNEDIEAINILTLIKKTKKRGKFDQYLDDGYNHLSEFTHPNIPYSIRHIMPKIEMKHNDDSFIIISDSEYNYQLLILAKTLEMLEFTINDCNKLLENQIKEQIKKIYPII